MSKARRHERIKDEDRERWPLTAALIDCASYPDSPRFWLWLSNLTRAAGQRITSAGTYPTSAPGRFIDVLGVTTEFDYFLSFPSTRN